MLTSTSITLIAGLYLISRAVELYCRIGIFWHQLYGVGTPTRRKRPSRTQGAPPHGAPWFHSWRSFFSSVVYRGSSSARSSLISFSGFGSVFPCYRHSPLLFSFSSKKDLVPYSCNHRALGSANIGFKPDIYNFSYSTRMSQLPYLPLVL